jgi:hypothetical protein
MFSFSGYNPELFRTDIFVHSILYVKRKALEELFLDRDFWHGSILGDRLNNRVRSAAAIVVIRRGNQATVLQTMITRAISKMRMLRRCCTGGRLMVGRISVLLLSLLSTGRSR